MHRLRPDPELTMLHQQISRGLLQCLLVGLALCLLFPAARGQSVLLGWMPLWLIGAPALSLLLLKRHVLFAATTSRTSDPGGLRWASRRGPLRT